MAVSKNLRVSSYCQRLLSEISDRFYGGNAKRGYLVAEAALEITRFETECGRIDYYRFCRDYIRHELKIPSIEERVHTEQASFLLGTVARRGIDHVAREIRADERFELVRDPKTSYVLTVMLAFLFLVRSSRETEIPVLTPLERIKDDDQDQVEA